MYVDDVYAWALFRAGRFTEAREISDRAISLGTPDAKLSITPARSGWPPAIVRGCHSFSAPSRCIHSSTGRARPKRRSSRAAPPAPSHQREESPVRKLSTVAALMVLTTGTALAHTVGLSRGEYRVAGSSVHAELVFARGELAGAVPALDANKDGTLSDLEVSLARTAIHTELVHRLEMRGSSGTCSSALHDVHLTEEDGISVKARFLCAGKSQNVHVELAFLPALSRGHRHLATVVSGNGTVRHVGYAGDPGFDVLPDEGGRASRWMGAWPLFRLGVEHILTGYDHLVFLLGLILVGGRLRSLLVIVTAFTLGHSITLALAALRVWTPSGGLIEPAIALSIVYIGIENWFVSDAARRWMITFPFGLVHGFGFAGALEEIALPTPQIPVALAAFNGGVEAGQLAVLAMILPAVLWLRRREWFAVRGLRVVSGAIAAAGLCWFVARVAF